MSNINWDFTDKKVLIVGDSRGIGSQVFKSFQMAGAEVYGINSNNCDISNIESINSFFTYGFEPDEIDILVNVAGINYTHKIENISLTEWDEVLDTNLRSFFYITQQVLYKMESGGRIVNVSSIAGRNKSIGNSGVHYTASKAGIIGLTKQIAHEVGSRNINVNAVCPSQTKTDMLQQSMTEEEIKELGKSIPLGRIAEVQEVVNGILFLCSEESSYITGTTLDINGGQL
jgi:NAD(P)-dependent dehydrogenase (short-subunit alcohol dehydrogenase family)